MQFNLDRRINIFIYIAGKEDRVIREIRNFAKLLGGYLQKQREREREREILENFHKRETNHRRGVVLP